MIVSKRRRRTVLTIPVVLLGMVVAANPTGIWQRLTGDDPAAKRPAATLGVRQLTVVASGDILVHPPAWEQAADHARLAGRDGYDFTPMFAQIKPVVAGADLALCHLETPVAEAAPLDFPSFRAPAEIIDAIKDTGWDGCSTASNHSFDHGEAGVRSTLNLLDQAGLPHTGTYTSRAAADLPLIYTVNGVKVAHLSFASMFNESRGKFRPREKPWMANSVGDPGAVARAARAARTAGADIVILSPHWGTELTGDPNRRQVRLAQEYTSNPDIDIILAHHTHSVQPAEMVNGKWVFYSMGNALGRHDFPNDINRQGILARITFTQSTGGRWAVSKAEAVPIWQGVRPDVEVVSVPLMLTKLTRVDHRRGIYQRAFDRIQDRVLARGGAAHGLTVVGEDR